MVKYTDNHRHRIPITDMYTDGWIDRLTDKLRDKRKTRKLIVRADTDNLKSLLLHAGSRYRCHAIPYYTFLVFYYSISLTSF